MGGDSHYGDRRNCTFTEKARQLSAKFGGAGAVTDTAALGVCPTTASGVAPTQRKWWSRQLAPPHCLFDIRNSKNQMLIFMTVGRNMRSVIQHATPSVPPFDAPEVQRLRRWIFKSIVTGGNWYDVPDSQLAVQCLAQRNWHFE